VGKIVRKKSETISMVSINSIFFGKFFFS